MTALSFYTRAQADSIKAALETVEQMATEKGGKDTLQ